MGLVFFDSAQEHLRLRSGTPRFLGLDFQCVIAGFPSREADASEFDSDALPGNERRTVPEELSPHPTPHTPHPPQRGWSNQVAIEGVTLPVPEDINMSLFTCGKGESI
jgi:hypothetical protein